MKVLLGFYQLSPSSIVLNFKLFAFLIETFSLTIRGDSHCYKKLNINSVFTTDRFFSFNSMATLRNKRKLAEKHSETHENTKNTQSRNTIDPEMAQEYFTQVSEEIEGRVTKKLSKEFSRTESRILGALPKLEIFLVKPHVRTCSVAVPGTSRNSKSENRELTGDRSLYDPCPEVRYSSHHSSNLTSPEVEDYPHKDLLQNGWYQDMILCRVFFIVSNCSLIITNSANQSLFSNWDEMSSGWCVLTPSEECTNYVTIVSAPSKLRIFNAQTARCTVALLSRWKFL